VKKKKTSRPQGTQCGSLGQLLNTHFIYEHIAHFLLTYFVDFYCFSILLIVNSTVCWLT
jgi:hypothetical protein